METLRSVVSVRTYTDPESLGKSWKVREKKGQVKVRWKISLKIMEMLYELITLNYRQEQQGSRCTAVVFWAHNQILLSAQCYTVSYCQKYENYDGRELPKVRRKQMSDLSQICIKSGQVISPLLVRGKWWNFILTNSKNPKFCSFNNMPRPCKLTFDLLTLKVVSESSVTWATSVQF